MADRFKRCLKPHFKYVKELRFKVSKLNENSWAYAKEFRQHRAIDVGIPVEQSVNALEGVNADAVNYFLILVISNKFLSE